MEGLWKEEDDRRDDMQNADMHAQEFDTDDEDAIQKYLITTPHELKSHEKPQTSEDAAFQVWMATGMHETSPESETLSGTQTVSALTAYTKAHKIIAAPRQYQLDLFERAKQKNSIIVLDTGSGKTLIAALLLRHTLDGELENRAQGLPPKTAFFIVDKIVLCLQQYNVLCANLEHSIGIFHGNTVASDLRNRDDWNAQAREHMVIVLTAQVLLDLLGNGLLSMSQINLLIFDEAHHTKKNHPYAKIVKDHYRRAQGDRPRILGMTASPIDTRTGDLRLAAQELEAMLCGQIATISDETLLRETERKEQIELVVYYSPVLSPEEARTRLWREMNRAFALRREFSNHLGAAQDVASALGAFCADEYWKMLFASSATSKLSNCMSQDTTFSHEDIIGTEGGDEVNAMEADFEPDYVNDVVHQARSLVTAHSHKCPSIDMSTNGFSSKFITLRDLLSDAFLDNQTRRCIVFVGKRYFAALLAHAFSQPEIRIPNMSPAYVVGSQSNSSGIANMSVKDQFDALYQFRNGTINCLFATQVAEEGIDIPDCDLVIRFDLYQSAIQYIQSRGRARQGKSTFITMMEKDSMDHHRKWLEATRNTNALRRFVSILSEDRKVSGVDDTETLNSLEAQSIMQRTHQIPETGAQLTFHSSQQVLSKFVSSLSNSSLKRFLTAEYAVTPTLAGRNFVATVILPDLSPIKSFQGTPQRNKILARGSAAFGACLELIQKKYIDGHLQPTLRKRIPALRNARLAISAKKGAEYELCLRPAIWSKLGCPSELYLTVLLSNGSVMTGEQSRPIGLLTRSKLPRMPSIKLYFDRAAPNTAILQDFDKPLLIDRGRLELLTNFTLVIFKDVFSKEFDCEAENLPYFLAPCVSSLASEAASTRTTADMAVDWSLLWEIKDDDVDTNPQRKFSEQSIGRLVTDPWDGGRKLIVRSVAPHLRPFDPVPSGVPAHRSPAFYRVEQNIAEYSNSLTFHSRRRQNWNADQPVFSADVLPLRRNFLSPLETNAEDVSKSCFIILDPLRVSPLTADIVLAALTLPVVMYRVDSVAIAMDACRFLDLPDIDSSLALEAFTKDSSNTDEHGEEQIEFQQGMGNNYERLEFLGDVFLKMATTISLFTLLPGQNEFEYHVERMIMVCNKNLFNHAVDRKLQQFVRCHAFDRRTWYPDLPLKKGKAPKRLVNHSLADKSIADVCEAVIGAAYMTEPKGHMDMAVKAVTKMVRAKRHTMTKFGDYFEHYKVPDWQLGKPSAAQHYAVQKLEKTLGYTFRSPALLRSAFKHPSYPYEVEIPNYQRLEFLGDALLDLTAADHLFRNFADADPQWLTEHKMSMVSNHFYACLCIELGLHRHLLAANSSMKNRIPEFALELDHAKRESALSSGGKGTQSDFWVNVSQPPKALGDVLEAVVGAMFVDSKYNYDVVQTFFDRFILPYFGDISLYDAYAAGHPVTLLTKRMQDGFRCRSWRLCLSTVPCSSEEGVAALTEDNVLCALMVHGKAVAHATRASSRDAKLDVAARVMRRFRDMEPHVFRAEMKCDCVATANEGKDQEQ